MFCEKDFTSGNKYNTATYIPTKEIVCNAKNIER